jgi:hypothetical protein
MKRFWSCIAVFLASLGLDAYAQGLAPDCAAIHDANPGAADGNYVISSAGRTFRVYCHDMAGNPRDYLTLVNTGGNFNYSTHGNVGGGPPTPVTTHYTRVRLDPGTLLVNIGDQTFATSDGFDCCYGTTPVTSMPYATAGSCDDRFGLLGTANVDLTGTPFIVDDVFSVGGWFARGSANSGDVFTFADQQIGIGVQAAVVNTRGGGGCGATSPKFPAGGINTDGGFDLQLAFAGPSIELDKNSCKNGAWQELGVFKNQGDCVSFFATGGKNPPAL